MWILKSKVRPQKTHILWIYLYKVQKQSKIKYSLFRVTYICGEHVKKSKGINNQKFTLEITGWDGGGVTRKDT